MAEPDIKSKVLLIHSDADWLHAVENSIKAHSQFAISTLQDTTATLDLLEHNPPQVIVTDTTIGSDSGLDLANRIRERYIAKPEIVFVSSDPQVSLFDIHQVGACHVLPKPLDVERLTALLKQITHDQRRTDRVIIDPTTLGHLFGKVSFSKNKNPGKVEVSNLGRGGFFFRIDNGEKLPEVGTILEFELKLTMVPDCTLEGKGIVRWNHQTIEGKGAGIEFIQLNEETRRFVNAFVDLFKVKSFVPES